MNNTLLYYISIHAPTRGATHSSHLCSISALDFNPRSHERSDTRPTSVPFLLLISIHAPTRGATLVPPLFHFCS